MGQECYRDHVVIGSGFGGAVTVHRLTEAGLEVCLLERGRRYMAGDFPRPLQGDLEGFRERFRVDRLLWQHDQGLLDARSLGDMTTLVGAGLGGGSLVYANVHIRPPDEVFDHPRWQATGLDRAALDPHYAQVEAMLDVAPTPDTLPAGAPDAPRAPVHKARAFEAAAQGLGRTAVRPNLAVRFKPPTEDNGHGRAQGTCVGCGGCDFGCQHHAKNTLDLNYIAEAEATGRLEIRTLTEAYRIEPAGAEIQKDHPKARYTVIYFDHLQRARRSIHAHSVFLCAGAVGSTELLLRSATPTAAGGPALDQLSPRLGGHFTGNVDAIALVVGAKTDDGPRHVEPTFGPVITSALRYKAEVHPVTGAEGADAPDPSGSGLSPRPIWALLQDGGFPPEYGALFEILAQAWWTDDDTLNGAWRAGLAERLKRRVGRLASPFAPLRGASPPADPGGPLRLGGLSALFGLSKGPDLGVSPSPYMVQVAQGMRAQVERVVVAQILRRTGLEDLLPLALARGSLNRQLGGGAISQWLADGLRYFFHPQNHRTDRAVFLAMGRDLASGTLSLHPAPGSGATPRLRLKTDLSANSLHYHTQERLMRDMAHQYGGRLRVNPMWSLLRRPITVHGQGGCSMGPTAEDGVVDLRGEAHGHPGLYVLDGSIFPAPVGVNPSHTIAAVAEHHMAQIVAELAPKRPSPQPNPQLSPDPTRALWGDTDAEARLSPGASMGVRYLDLLVGHVAPGEIPDPIDPAAALRPSPEQIALYRLGERRGRGMEGQSHRLRLNLTLTVPDVDRFLDPRPTVPKRHRPDLSVQTDRDLDARIALYGTLGGHVEIGGPHLKLQAPITAGHFIMRAFEPNVAPSPRGPGPLGLVPVPSGGVRYLDYGLRWTCPEGGHRDFSGRTLQLRGFKWLYEQPGMDLIADFSTLYATLSGVDDDGPPLTGVFRVHLIDFLARVIQSFEVIGHGREDPQAGAATLQRFGRLIFGEIWDTYGSELARGRLEEWDLG